MDCAKQFTLAAYAATLYVDNGPAYQHHQLGRMAARLGLQLVYATPYHPQGKGKIERFYGHVKTSFYPDAKRAGPRNTGSS